MAQTTPSQVFLPTAVTIWLIFLLVGVDVLLHYQRIPGESAAAPAVWPTLSTFFRNADRPVVLLFLHPRCANSLTSLNELEKMMPTLKGRADVSVTFYKPSHVNSDWLQSQLWFRAQEIPGIHILVDEGGQEAERFGAKTSGQVLLYSTSGKLIFQGGLTASREHRGEADGQEAILRFIESQEIATPFTITYGCALFKMTPTFGDQ